MKVRINWFVSLLSTLLLAASVVVPIQAAPLPPTYTGPERQALNQYAVDTWQSFLALTYPNGLPSDNIYVDGTRARYTSPTNIGAYIWSTITARDLQIITPLEATQRIQTTLDTLQTMERGSAGMFYNWYDPETGAKLTVWPPDGSTVYPFLSTVDNGWLATALILVSNSIPQLRSQALSLLDAMNFGFFLDPNDGQLYGGYWPDPGPNCSQNGGYTCFDFGTLNTEPRISSYIGIAMGDLPPSHYFRLWRTFPDNCDWSWPEMEPKGVTRTYLGVDVFEGHYTYAGMNLVPSWGGSMFEALMPNLFVPEAQWGPQNWGINHPLYVKAQIYHGLQEAQYGYWGFSPATNPSGGYMAYGVDAIGMNTDGYPSNNDNTFVDYGFDNCPGRTTTSIPPASAYTNGVVTPHASFLALEFAPREALANLAKMRQNFNIYGKWGFWDSVNVQNGQVSQYALALDQGMVMAALDNALRNDAMQKYFSQGMIETAIKPILQMEQFTAGPATP